MTTLPPGWSIVTPPPPPPKPKLPPGWSIVGEYKPPSSGTYLSGGPVEDIFDILRTGEYAVGGLLSGKGALRGIRERIASGPQFAVRFQQAGMPDTFATDAAAFVASLVVDPINLVGVGLVGKGLRAVGAVRAATALERVGPAISARIAAPVGRAVEAIGEHVPAVGRAVRSAAARRTLEPVLETQVIKEAQGAERVIDLGTAIRKDALLLTRNLRNARRLDQALGGYFDAGADTMLNHIAQTQQLGTLNVVPAQVVRVARQNGEAAQRVFLQSLTPEVRGFVQKWAPIIAQHDTDLAQNLVRVGMMRPETAAKWEGFHLRRIYQKFEDPQAFVAFLERTDPGQAAQLLGQIERGVPIRKVGQPIPTAVVKARKEVSAATAGRLGEIQQASSRLVAGGTLAERAVARGEAYQKIASQFAVPDAIVSAHPLAHELFRQLPDTGGWGALAGKWLPREMADTLTNLTKKPQDIDAFLSKVTGWFKFSKVILNPATHFRNIRTNLSLIHNSVGFGGLRPDIMAKAIREVATNGQAFREAKGVSSAFIETFTNDEIRRFVGDLDQARTPLQMVLAPFRWVGRQMARAYEFEEQAGKMAVYLTARGRGLSPQAAAKIAETALFNYRKVPPTIAKMRSRGFYPFITFPYKVATETLPQALRRPGRFSQQAKTIAAGQRDIPPEEGRVLPPYMRGGSFIRLPWKDSHGRPLYYDLTYELAYGDIAESGTPTGQLAAMLRGEARGLEVIAPLLTPIGQLIAEIVLNKSIFTGGELRRKGETFGRAVTRQIARTALPGGIFGVGETVLAKLGAEPEPTSPLARALTGTQTRLGDQPADVVPAVAATFGGLRTVPIDVSVQRRARRLDLKRVIDEARSEIFSIRANPNLTPEEKRVRIRTVTERMREAIRSFRGRGFVVP